MLQTNEKYLKFSNLSGYAEIENFTTTRRGGNSEGYLESLNFGYNVGDNQLLVASNYYTLSESLGIDSESMVLPKQTHSNNIGVVTKYKQVFPDTDALITNTPGVCLCVKTADCVPILLFDPIKNAVAAVHSGWRGTVKRILQFVVAKMQEIFDSSPDNIIAGIGPSIGPEVYEVGQDVIDQVQATFKNKKNIIHLINDENKALFNLWEANRQILLDCGLRDENIEIAGLCTYSNPGYFYSARRMKGKTGRMLTGIIIKNDR